MSIPEITQRIKAAVGLFVKSELPTAMGQAYVVSLRYTVGTLILCHKMNESEILTSIPVSTLIT